MSLGPRLVGAGGVRSLGKKKQGRSHTPVHSPSFLEGEGGAHNETQPLPPPTSSLSLQQELGLQLPYRPRRTCKPSAQLRPSGGRGPGWPLRAPTPTPDPPMGSFTHGAGPGLKRKQKDPWRNARTDSGPVMGESARNAQRMAHRAPPPPPRGAGQPPPTPQELPERNDNTRPHQDVGTYVQGRVAPSQQ